MRFLGLALLLLSLAACGRGGSNGTAASTAQSGRADGPKRQGVAPVASSAPDGLRVSINPSSGDFAFVVDFAPSSLDCRLYPGEEASDAGQTRPICSLVRVRYNMIGRGEPPLPRRDYSFFVPEQEFRDVDANFEALAERWQDPGPDRDGTVIAVERNRRGRSLYLASDRVEPGNPAAFLAGAVHRLLLAYGPAGTVPRAEDFTISSQPYGPCQPTDFVTPDPDGFGVGADTCARHRNTRAAPPARGASGAR